MKLDDVKKQDKRRISSSLTVIKLVMLTARGEGTNDQRVSHFTKHLLTKVLGT